MEQPPNRNEESLEIYLQGKSNEELAAMVEDPLGVLTTHDGDHPTVGFELDELKQEASSELESRSGSAQ